MTTDLHDPWSLDTGPEPTESKFRPSLVARAKKRTVRFNPSDGDYIVTGDSSLGDSRSAYTVTPNGKRYECACYSSNHGEARRHSICSHVVAVILFRQEQKKFVESRLTTSIPTRDTLPTSEEATAGTSTVGQGDPSPLVPLPSDPRFGKPAIPARFSTIRPHQWAAVEAIVEEFQTKDLVFVDAPTGSGKTLIGELVRRLVTPNALYICSSIQLQAQALDSFPYAREIKGRSNYPTMSGPEEVTCADCTAAPPVTPECFWCAQTSLCPYRLAKAKAATSDLAVLNTSYFLHVANHAKEFGDRGLVIVDEADTLEQNLMGFVEVSIGQRLMKELDLGQPRHVTKPEAWEEWLNLTVIPRLAGALADMPASSTDVQQIRRRKNLEQLVSKVKTVAAGVTSGNWVFDDYQQGKATFRPIRVDEWGAESLWQHGKKWLLMSATLISPDELAESLGWEGDFGVVRVPMTFAPENRPVRIVPVAAVTHKTKDTAYPQMGVALSNLARIHADERMLVHTVSYGLRDHLEAALKDAGFGKRVVTYKSAAGRDAALVKFRKTKGGILLAPSMDRGVDLPGDDANVVVVCKIPFLSLGDKQVAARLHSKGGQSWYVVQAIRSLVQMTGRHVRSAEDKGVSYVLDATFTSNIWAQHRALLPGWWKEAIDWSFPKREIVSVG